MRIPEPRPTLDVAATLTKGRGERMYNRSSTKNRAKASDGSLSSRDLHVCDPLAEALDRSMDLAELRDNYVSRLKQEIAGGRYAVASADLAARLLDIAERKFH